MDFLGKCLYLQVVPKGFNLGKKRFHKDLNLTVQMAGQILIQGQLNRLWEIFGKLTGTFNKSMQNMWKNCDHERVSVIYQELIEYANHKRATLYAGKIKKLKSLSDIDERELMKPTLIYPPPEVLDEDNEITNIVNEIPVENLENSEESVPEVTKSDKRKKDRLSVKNVMRQIRQVNRMKEHVKKVKAQKIQYHMESDHEEVQAEGNRFSSGKVKNISDIPMPKAVESFLSLNPKFCPTPLDINVHEHMKDLNHMEIIFRIGYTFRDKTDQRSEEEKRFYISTGWTPSAESVPNVMNAFFVRLKQRLSEWTQKRRITSNITEEQRKGQKLVEGGEGGTHVYKVEDKGSSICRIKK